jgi:hypothetical protein
MLDHPFVWRLASRLPMFFSGTFLHRRALAASAAGRYADAERLYEAAANRYREDLCVEPMARLRAHQLISRVRSVKGNPGAVAILEVENRLRRLETIESLEAPHLLVPSATARRTRRTLIVAAESGDGPNAMAASVALDRRHAFDILPRL